MAEWRKVAKTFALGDGHISQKEVNLLRQVLFAGDAPSPEGDGFLRRARANAPR